MVDRDQDVLDVVQKHGTVAIWHYTLCESLPSIIENDGIYARAELRRRCIAFRSEHYYGAGRREAVLGEYVACAPLPPWGMMQSENEEIAVLRLDASVMAMPGTCFCPGWSPRGDFDPDEIVTWTGPERLEELYSGTGPAWVLPAEIFVPNAVPLELLDRIVFFDDRTRDCARKLMVAAARRRATKIGRTIGLSVDPSRFPRQWKESGPPWEEEADAPKF
jgi:hypothetical protein